MFKMLIMNFFFLSSRRLSTLKHDKGIIKLLLIIFFTTILALACYFMSCYLMVILLNLLFNY